MITKVRSDLNLHKHNIWTPYFHLFDTESTRYVRVNRVAYKHPSYFTRGANKPERIVTGKQATVQNRFHALATQGVQ